MSLGTVRSVSAWEALDSRGRPTVACRVSLAGGGEGRVVVPSGASVSGYEAKERRDGGARYGGWGVQGAVASVNGPLAGAVVGLDAGDQAAVDAALEAASRDPLLGDLGANAVVGVSLAVLLAAADQARQPLWRLLGGDRPLLPRPMVNIVSGGAHAAGLLDLQDVLVVPLGAKSFAEALERAWRVREATASVLASTGAPTGLVADEGGLAGPLASNEQALEAVTKGAHLAGFEPGKDVAVALDLAANQFHRSGSYELRAEGLRLSRAEWLGLLGRWCERYPVVSLEDPLHEDDWEGWQQLSRQLGPGRQVLGDDLFGTNLARLRQGIELSAANAVLVKPNQAGTVSRALAVLREAQAAGYATVMSARSGDSEDYWLADLAVGWRAGQVKVGSTTRSERTAKWNRLLEIEAAAGGRSELWCPAMSNPEAS